MGFGRGSVGLADTFVMVARGLHVVWMVYCCNGVTALMWNLGVRPDELRVSPALGSGPKTQPWTITLRRQKAL